MDKELLLAKSLVSKFAILCNTVLLCIHIGFLTTFFILDAPIMVYLNIISILFYAILYIVQKRNISVYVISVYAEILIHMMFATVCMGWDCGYQLYCFMLIPLVYLSSYLAKKKDNKKIYSLLLSIFTVIVFITARFYTYNTKPVYFIEDTQTISVIYVLNIICIFFCVILYMTIMENFNGNFETMLRKSADYDELTGLANRHRMNGVLDHIYQECLNQNVPFAVAILDIDDFKKVNDKYGHFSGDKVLCHFSSILKEIEQDNTYTCRWGGEEFLIISTGMNSYQYLIDTVEKVREKILNSMIPVKDTKISISISAGIASFKYDDTMDDTILRADKYLYEAKNSGKNKVVARD